MKRWLALLVATALLGASCSSDSETESEAVGIFDIQIGDCFNHSSNEADDEDVEVSEVSRTDCDASHDSEVFSKFDLADETEFPGTDRVVNDAYAGCVDRFGDYVGTDFVESDYYVGQFYPSESTWTQIGDREVICYLIYSAGQLEGSARDVGAE